MKINLSESRITSINDALITTNRIYEENLHSFLKWVEIMFFGILPIKYATLWFEPTKLLAMRSGKERDLRE